MKYPLNLMKNAEIKKNTLINSTTECKLLNQRHYLKHPYRESCTAGTIEKAIFENSGLRRDRPAHQYTSHPHLTQTLVDIFMNPKNLPSRLN